jgi:hypothetical protein
MWGFKPCPERCPPERRGRALAPLDGDARIATHRRTKRPPVRRFCLDFPYIVMPRQTPYKRNNDEGFCVKSSKTNDFFLVSSHSKL